ncbi:MAG TPA: hypothetical protein VFY88_04645 [Intrasporangium sp.]|nr:hypothetical protein [Intrasporangium sp.]
MTVPGPALSGPRGTVLLLGFVATAAGVLAATLASSVATVVVGVILLGVLHAILELRYVAGRYSGLALGLGRRFLGVLALLLVGAVVSRLLVGLVGRSAQVAEVVLGYAIVGWAIARVMAARRRRVAWALTGLAATASLVWPDHHFLVLAHVHLLAVLAFLWDWSRRLPSARSRRMFRLVQLAWATIIPLAILLGTTDAWLGTDTAVVRSLVEDGHAVIEGTVPPGMAGTTLGMRLFAVFAFLQTMHLLIWVVFFPRYAPDAGADLEDRLPWLTGARVWAIGFLAAALLAVLLVSDYASGAVLHDAVTLPHVYVEVPVLLALVGRSRSRDDTVAPASVTTFEPGRAETPVQNHLAPAGSATYGRARATEGGDPRSDFFRNV